MACDDDEGDFAGKVFLRGPRAPQWKCFKCGTADNFANRPQCHICDARAPARAFRNAVAQHRQPRAAAPRGPAGKWANGRPPAPDAPAAKNAKDKKIDALQAELKALKAKQPAARSLPIGCTRTAEYPMLVCPALHGTPHQSKEEVLATPRKGMRFLLRE